MIMMQQHGFTSPWLWCLVVVSRVRGVTAAAPRGSNAAASGLELDKKSCSRPASPEEGMLKEMLHKDNKHDLATPGEAPSATPDCLFSEQSSKARTFGNAKEAGGVSVEVDQGRFSANPTRQIFFDIDVDELLGGVQQAQVVHGFLEEPTLHAATLPVGAGNYVVQVEDPSPPPSSRSTGLLMKKVRSDYSTASTVVTSNHTTKKDSTLCPSSSVERMLAPAPFLGGTSRASSKAALPESDEAVTTRVEEQASVEQGVRWMTVDEDQEDKHIKIKPKIYRKAPPQGHPQSCDQAWPSQAENPLSSSDVLVPAFPQPLSEDEDEGEDRESGAGLTPGASPQHTSPPTSTGWSSMCVHKGASDPSSRKDSRKS
ncbi:unnamed protein product, partial [Amoebophrya sp. A25]|eukprot:GSA25T00006987001.1